MRVELRNVSDNSLVEAIDLTLSNGVYTGTLSSGETLECTVNGVSFYGTLYTVLHLIAQIFEGTFTQEQLFFQYNNLKYGFTHPNVTPEGD
jgi:hypothetical protein